MIHIKRAEKQSETEIARFIARVNKLKNHHIGYCGTDEEEILHYLKEEMTDIPFQDCFLLAYEDDSLIGVIGFEADLDNHHGEIWGPFITHDDWQGIAKNMWNDLIKMIPSEMDSVSLFVNKLNVNVNEFSRALSCAFNEKTDSHTILLYQKEVNGVPEKVPFITEITETEYSTMIKIHDIAFPKGYYDGEKIVQRMNDDDRVFVYKENDTVIGYIYVESQPLFGEGSIEFFAVNEGWRGRGIGKKLLQHALHWLLSKDFIEELRLTVNSENAQAIHLYQAVGFTVENELNFYEVKF
ncbi:MAG TPA: GNAT family N-acetyltransferase [Bacillaceae bacterium]|nr:GNAT family N-acetyltransferase [Bacillaceae bacterium]